MKSPQEDSCENKEIIHKTAPNQHKKTFPTENFVHAQNSIRSSQNSEQKSEKSSQKDSSIPTQNGEHSTTEHQINTSC